LKVSGGSECWLVFVGESAHHGSQSDLAADIASSTHVFFGEHGQHHRADALFALAVFGVALVVVDDAAQIVRTC